MKFTKKEALEKLKQILTEGGKTLRMSKRSLENLTDNLMGVEKENEEMDLDAFVAKYKDIYVSFNGNVEHDVSSGVNEFKTKWEQDHQGKGGEGDGGQGGSSGEPDAKTKELLDRIDALERANKEQKTKQTISEKKKSILAKLKEKGIEDDDWTKGMLEQISVDENTDVDSKSEQLLNFYNKTKSSPLDPITPKVPGGGEPQKNNAIALAAQRAKQAREEIEASRD